MSDRLRLSTTRYALRDPKTGSFLKVTRNASYGGRKRSWVTAINGATLWNKSGDVSNAWLCAVGLKFARPSMLVEVVAVDLAVVMVTRKVKTAMVPSYYTIDGTRKAYGRHRRIVDAK